MGRGIHFSVPRNKLKLELLPLDTEMHANGWAGWFGLTVEDWFSFVQSKRLLRSHRAACAAPLLFLAIFVLTDCWEMGYVWFCRFTSPQCKLTIPRCELTLPWWKLTSSHITLTLPRMKLHLRHITLTMPHITLHLRHIKLHLWRVTLHLRQITLHSPHITLHLRYITLYLRHITLHLRQMKRWLKTENIRYCPLTQDWAGLGSPCRLGNRKVGRAHADNNA